MLSSTTKKKLPIFRSGAFIAMVFAGMSSNPANAQSVPGNWTLTFADEFDGTSLDTTHWHTEKRIKNLIINDEKQFYYPENIEVSNGTLKLIAKEELTGYVRSEYDFNNNGVWDPENGIVDVNDIDGDGNTTETIYEQAWTQDYTSGVIASHHHVGNSSNPNTVGFTQTHGLFEARIKMPSAEGLWPAWWLLPDKGPSVPDAERWTIDRTGNDWGVEYDIMEYITGWGDYYHTNTHWGYGDHWWHSAGDGGVGDVTHYVQNITSEFHTYSMYWDSDTVIYYVDGEIVQIFEEPSINSSIPHYMILNLAVGGVWPEGDGFFVDPNDLPATMEVDWVRVYSGTPYDLGFNEMEGVGLKEKGWTGSVSENNGTYTISAGGEDFSGDGDEGFFLGTRVPDGDFTLTGRVVSINGGDTYWSKAGLMVRDNTATGGAMAFAGQGRNGWPRFTRRIEGGDIAVSGGLSSSGGSPQWFQLRRVGDFFFAYNSSDGVNWNQYIAAGRALMNDTTFAGFAVTANDDSLMATATFDNFSVVHDGPNTNMENFALSASLSSVSSQGTSSPATCLIDDVRGKELISSLGQVDNGADNYWVVTSFPQTIEIDLGEDQEIWGADVIGLKQFDGDPFRYYYSIESRPEGGSYQTIADHTTNAELKDGYDDFTPMDARYVRFTFTGVERATDKYENNWVNHDWLALTELRVWGDGVATGSGGSGSDPSPLPIAGVSASYEQTGNEAVNSADGNMNTRWSAIGDQWIEWDLGTVESVSAINIAFYKQRNYSFDIQYFDGSNWINVFANTQESSGANEDLETFTFPLPVSTQYIRYYGYGSNANTWNSIWEVEIMGTGSQGATGNVALNKTISDFSWEETGNPATNLVDGVDDTDDNRWSAYGFPHWVEIDLGADMSISSTELTTYQGRAYQFYVEARPASGSYQTIVDRTSNTSGTGITDSFSPVTARYVRITVTGASGYPGNWVSLREFKVFGSGGN